MAKCCSLVPVHDNTHTTPVKTMKGSLTDTQLLNRLRNPSIHLAICRPCPSFSTTKVHPSPFLTSSSPWFLRTGRFCTLIPGSFPFPFASHIWTSLSACASLASIWVHDLLRALPPGACCVRAAFCLVMCFGDDVDMRGPGTESS